MQLRQIARDIGSHDRMASPVDERLDQSLDDSLVADIGVEVVDVEHYLRPKKVRIRWNSESGGFGSLSLRRTCSLASEGLV